MRHALEPAPRFCGCDASDVASAKLIPFDVALRKGLALATPVSEIAAAPLSEAVGRILAERATTRTPLPPFDNSAMDGYAIRLSDLQGPPPWRLPVLLRVAAGDGARAEIPPGAAARIFTGAPVPDGFDAVAMQEHVTRDGDEITLSRKPALGENIRRMGEDLRMGGCILEAGRRLGPREIGALAAIGESSVSVRRKVRVALFSTGSELREPGEPLAIGQIWNSNRFMLMADLAEPWIELVDFGTVRDNAETLKEVLAAAAAKADIVVSTGGVSVGDEDHMPNVVRAIGGRIEAMRVAMKPGKPVTIGACGAAIYIGLPGNPVSAYVTWSLIGRKILEKRAGLASRKVQKMIVKAGFNLDRRTGRCEFRPATIVDRDAAGVQIVELCEPSFSARIASLANADGLALLSAADAKIREGRFLEFVAL